MRESRTEQGSASTKIDGSFRRRAEANFRNRKFGKICSAIWEKPDFTLAAIAGVSDRAARDYLSGKVAPPAIVIAAIVVEITKRD
jgi:hypothetical protein